VKDSLEWWQLISEKRCDGYSHSQEDDYYNEALRAFLTKVKSKTLTPEDENPKGLWAPMGVVDTSTSQGCNFCIRSLFGALNSSLERSIREIQIFGEKHDL
jgi:hypothetical protein